MLSSRCIFMEKQKMKKFKLPPDIQKDVDDTVRYLGGGCSILLFFILILAFLATFAETIGYIYHLIVH